MRPLPESKAVGMLAALPQKTLRHVDATPDLVMPLPAMLLSNACNAVTAFLYEKGVKYQCWTTAKRVAVRAARQLAFKIVGLSRTARNKPLHNRCTFHVEKLLRTDFRVCSEVLQLSFETHHRLREKRKIFVSYVLC